MKTELKFNGIDVTSMFTKLETLLILDEYAYKIENSKAQLFQFFEDRGYKNEEITITVDITITSIYVNGLSSTGDNKPISFTYKLIYTDIYYTKERNERGLAAKEEAKAAEAQAAKAAKAAAETLRIKQLEATEAEKEAFNEFKKQEWIENNGSEYLKLLFEFKKDYLRTLQEEFCKKQQIPGFYGMGEIESKASVTDPSIALLKLAKELKNAGYEVTDFSEKSVEIYLEVFGEKIRVRCRPTA